MEPKYHTLFQAVIIVLGLMALSHPPMEELPEPAVEQHAALAGAPTAPGQHP